MMKKYFKKFLIPALLTIVTIGMVFVGSSISQRISKPIFISNAHELNNVRNNLDGYYVVTSDIYINDLQTDEGFDGWVPIGTEDNPFTGKIDFCFHKLIDLYFSHTYINDKFADDNCNNVLVGFLGCSSGTLIHCDIYRPHIPDFYDFRDINKTTTFGFACAVNNGYVTSTKVSFVGDDLRRLCGPHNFIGGGLIGVNNKQVLIAKVENTILVDVYGDAVFGGVIGICNNGSSNSFLFKGGYLQITIYGVERHLLCGGVVGKISGGTLNNVFFGSTYISQNIASLSIGFADGCENSFVCCGGAIGEYDSQNPATIKNIYVCNHLSIQKGKKCNYLGGIIGNSLSSNIKIYNSLFDGKFDCTNELIDCGSVLSGGNALISTNNFYTTRTAIDPSFSNLWVQEIDYANIQLSDLNWPSNTESGYWEKGKSFFYLHIL